MNKITLLLLLFCVTFANAQSSWKKIDSKNYKAKSELESSKTVLSQFDLYALDSDLIKKDVINDQIQLPVMGEMANFRIIESNCFTNSVASEYGYIKSFSLKGIDDKTATGKISIGTDGVHIIIFSANHSTYYIDPYTKNKTTYISYSKNDIENGDDEHTCLIEDHKTAVTKQNEIKTSHKNANDGVLRTYRLALASTIEYSDFHINNQGLSDNSSDTSKRAAVLSAMNTTVTRLNGVFEKEIGVSFNIVLNNNGENELIFIDDDELSNDDAAALLDESQAICDDIVGSNNYDIGHTFSTGAGGLAYLGVVCQNGVKGGGVTGRSFPVGDAFDIDLVAHEFGHQFGANHTFNGTVSNCAGANRNNATAVEPGSGSTIMAYAGICGSDNIQNSSDDYFHAISIDQMWNQIQSTSCAIETATNNTAPIVNAGNDFSVPKSTPLVLKGEATDSDSSNLTYCWEQIDNEITTTPPLATNIAGASFRSLPPTASPNRYLPILSTVISGNLSTEWEVLPEVAREMNFSLVVRDNNLNGGATERDDMNITFIDTDPFTVTTPNTNITWDIGATANISWDKSTTDIAPINCQNVRIKLSTDGGDTFPITLIESTPNDGDYSFTVPNQPTTEARIMIEALDNIFYNVNNTNFSIIASGPTFVMSAVIDNENNTKEVCKNENNSTVTYDLDIEFINNFSESVTLSITNLPEGVSATFSEQNITANSQVSITLENFETSSIGEYNPMVNGTSASISGSIQLPTLHVLSNEFNETSLTNPINNATNITTQNTNFEWDNTNTNATSYKIDIALDDAFNNIIFTADDITTNSYTISETLDWNTTFYWRVLPKNSCGNGNYSSTYSFKTENEEYCTSNFTIINEEFISNVTFNTINNDSEDDQTDGVSDGYEDFTNISTTVLTGSTHTLSVTLDPVGFDDHCYVFIDWNADSRFNTTTERYDLGNHNGDVSTATQEITIPEDATLGETRMRVIIEYFDSNTSFGNGPCDSDHNSEFGETEDYSINIASNTLSYEDDVFEDFLLELIIDEGIITLSFEIPNTEEDTNLNIYDLSGRLIKTYLYNSSTSPMNLSDLQSAFYIINIENGNKQTSKKIFIK